MPNRSIVEGCRDTSRLRPAPSWGGQATSVTTSYRSAVGGWGRRRFSVPTSEMGRDYRLGYSLTLLQRGHDLRVRPRCPAQREPGPRKPGPQPDGPRHGELVGADSLSRVPRRAGWPFQRRTPGDGHPACGRHARAGAVERGSDSIVRSYIAPFLCGVCPSSRSPPALSALPISLSCTALQPLAAIRRPPFNSLSSTLRGGVRSRSATRRSS